MRLAAVSLAAYFILAMGLAAYGANIDRIGMLIGAMPGMIGLLGMLLWLPSEDGLEAQATAYHRAMQARITSHRKAYSAARAGR